MNKIQLYALAIVFCSISPLYSQNIRINEICGSNYLSFEDEDDEHGDWVEFYNDGNSSIDMGGMYLTDDFADLTKFQIPTNDPSETRISSHNHLVFWFDDETYKGETHVSFKLSSNGEQIALVASDGITIIDSISFGALPYDVTYGRRNDGSSTWSYFPIPTPDQDNSGDGYVGIAGKVDFSIDAGFYFSSIQVVLNTIDTLGKIYYTLNGDEPSLTNRILYTRPINVAANTVIRSRVFKANYIPGDVATKSYFINRVIDLPVLSVVTDPSNLWDEETGIYTFGVDDYDHFYPYYGANFWHNWKRPAHIEFFLANGAEVISQNVNLSLSGNTSRVYAQKSLNFEAKDALGLYTIPYQFFPQLPIYNFKSFKLRNGGSDWSSTGIRDAFNHTLLEGAMDVDHQSNIPVILYLNGEYWGIMNLTEKIDENYLKGHYPSINKDSVDILYSNAEVVRGDADNYEAMIDFINDNSMTQQSNYEYIKTQIDIPGYINYVESRIYFASTDWPNKNIKYWRPRDQSRKWRWIMWDTDRSDLLTTNSNHPCDVDHNTLDWATTSSSVASWAQFLLNNLLRNQEFELQFITQFAHHMNFSFCPIRTDSILNVFRSRLNNELPAHIRRWKDTNDEIDYFTVGYYQSLAEWNTEVDTIKLFFDKRARYMREYIMDKFDIDNTSHLSTVKIPPQGGSILIDTFRVSSNPCNLVYFNDYPVTLTAMANPGYAFSGWSTNSGDTLPHTWVPDGDTTVTAYFTAAAFQPTVASTNFSSSGSNCNVLHLNWTSGNGASRIIIARSASPVNTFPVDQNAYTANTIFGNGDDLGNGNFVVYSGIGNSCTISGLTALSTYYFAIIEFNGISLSSNYNTSSYLTGSTTLSIPTITMGNDTTVCAFNSVLLDAGAGLNTYLWSTGETSQTSHTS